MKKSLSKDEYDEYFKILPATDGLTADPLKVKDGRRVEPDFSYTSDSNDVWMSTDELREWLENNQDKIGKI